MAREEQTKLERVIRLAAKADAAELAKIKRAPSRAAAGDEQAWAMSEELDFLDRLALPHGDDYFCLVADEDDQVVGYLIGGGSRDLDRKAHGEIYEIAVLPASQRRGVGAALLAEALERFDAAAFAGTLISVASDDQATARLAIGLGMRPDGYRDDERSIVRYERGLHASNRERPKP